MMNFNNNYVVGVHSEEVRIVYDNKIASWYSFF